MYKLYNSINITNKLTRRSFFYHVKSFFNLKWKNVCHLQIDFFLPFQNEISIWFEMRYHFSCFHNWLSKIVQSLSKSATFSKGSLANNPNGKIFFHFKWENTFHMIEKTSSDRKLQDRKGLVYSTSLHV